MKGDKSEGEGEVMLMCKEQVEFMGVRGTLGSLLAAFGLLRNTCCQLRRYFAFDRDFTVGEPCVLKVCMLQFRLK